MGFGVVVVCINFFIVRLDSGLRVFIGGVSLVGVGGRDRRFLVGN